MRNNDISGKKEIFSWAMYDFANSAFATTILTVVFNVYFATVVVGAGGARILGFNLPGDVLWGYVVSFSMILARDSRFKGSIYVASAIPGSVMIVAGLELTSTIS